MSSPRQPNQPNQPQRDTQRTDPNQTNQNIRNPGAGTKGNVQQQQNPGRSYDRE